MNAEGKSDQDMVAAGYEAMYSAGSELTSIDGMVLVGQRSALAPHMPFKSTTLNNGDTMYLEFTGTYNRYNAPVMRSGVIGVRNHNVQQVADAAMNTVKLLIENIKPGRTCNDIAQVSSKGLAPVSDKFWFHGAYDYSI